MTRVTELDKLQNAPFVNESLTEQLIKSAWEEWTSFMGKMGFLGMAHSLFFFEWCRIIKSYLILGT